MPDRIIDLIEKIVEKRSVPDAGRMPPLKPPSRPGPITRAAAWGIVVLFLIIPLFAVVGHGHRALWGSWAAISVWAGLDSRNIGSALPKRPTISDGTLVLVLALLNLLTALCALAATLVLR